MWSVFRKHLCQTHSLIKLQQFNAIWWTPGIFLRKYLQYYTNSETFSSHFNSLQSTQVNRCPLSIHTENFWFFDVFREYRKREKWVMGLVMDMYALVCRKPLSRNEKYVYHNYSFMLNAFRNLSSIFTMRLKKTHHYYFCVTINNMCLRFHTTGLLRYPLSGGIEKNQWRAAFPQITPRLLTTDRFHWLELITVISSFLKIFSLKKTFTYFCSISEHLSVLHLSYFDRIGCFL